MTTNLKLNGSKVTLTGDLLTGDTYRIKEFIKRELDGRWNADRKGWNVNPEKMAHALTYCYIYPEAETTTPAKITRRAVGDASTNGWCDKCHSYCWGDCTA
jgi:hypothetical protein